MINKNTKTSKIYNNVKTTSERHRHRYFINTDYTDRLEKNGMIVSAKAIDSDGSEIIEAIELKNHPYFIGVQFHPEFLARPFKPHPPGTIIASYFLRLVSFTPLLSKSFVFI